MHQEKDSSENADLDPTQQRSAGSYLPAGGEGAGERMNSLFEAFDTIVEAARAEYLEAERGLTRAAKGDAGTNLGAARVLVLRRARTAAVEMFHFSDRVHTAQPSWAPAGGLKNLRRTIQLKHCRMLRGLPVDDFDMIEDIANSFKHSKLTYEKERAWFIKDEGAVITNSTGYGSLAFGEGKNGGVEQVIVKRLDGAPRALSSVLQNVRDAWMSAMGRDLGAIGPPTISV